jgi:hypothetical protein
VTISDEAVEAAARTLRPYMDDDHFDLDAVARAALETAAPFIAAQAWDEGLAKGGHLAAWAIGNRPEPERPDTANPYRSGT